MKALVYGWFNHGNYGDQLFQPAFRSLFPELDFTFTDNITAEMVSNDRFGFFMCGGGSLLDGKPSISNEAIDIIKKMPIFYIGIGGETDIHPAHKELLEAAKLIAIRNDNIDVLANRITNKNIISIPDLVYALQPKFNPTKRNDKILFIPNFLVVPKHCDPYWKHSAWQRAKFSIAEALDKLCGERIAGVDCFSMSSSPIAPDQNAMIEIANQMEFGHRIRYFNPSDKFENDIRFISEYSAVITQRYHGIVLSELSTSPYIALYHHDKIANHIKNGGVGVDYYAISKHKLIEAFDAIYNKPTSFPSINLHNFDELVRRVRELL